MTDPGNLVLIGGEMPAFADEPARGPLLRWLATAATAAVPPGGRVLVAGPHEVELVESLAARAAVTCLRRSHADSVALARRCPQVRVLCGSLAKLGSDERFDAVVALAGLPRLTSAEGAQLAWGEALDALVAALQPGGRLLLALDNLLGVHELVAMAPWYADDRDAAWTPAGEHDRSRPASLRRLVARLTDAGLRVGSAFSGYPVPGAPTVVVGAGVEAEPVDAVVGAACADGLVGGPVLTDPRRLAASALRAGLGAELAPLWLVVADRGDAPPPRLPEIVVADAGRFAVAYEVTPAGLRRPLDERGSDERVAGAAGRVRRDPARLAGPAPRGRLLEELVLGACLRRDLPGLRRLLGEYAGWLAGFRADDGRLPGAHAFATPGNTVAHAGEFALLDPSWTLTGPVPYEVALARALRQLAVTLLTGGYAHPWPAALDADALAVILTGMAGRPVSRAVVAQAVELELEIVTETAGPAAAQRLVAVDGGAPPVDLDGHRELRHAAARLRAELEHARSKLAWYAELLDARDRSLDRAERALGALCRSPSYRVARALTGPARLVARGARRLRNLARRG